MKFSLHWLQDYIDLNVDRDELFHRLTMTGTEVEHFETRGVQSPLVVVAQILEAKQHPNADRLKVCRVNDGTEERQIVCGATNYKVGDKVPLALPGAELSGGLKIKESKLRGELSQGMMCSGKELGLGEDHEGLLILDPNVPLGKKLHEIQPADTLFDVEITPNRPDLLSYLGMAREIAAIGAGKLKPQPTVKIDWPANESGWRVKLDAGERVPVFTLTLLGNVKVGPSPAWLREKIEVMGHRSINNVVDVTNFVMWESGQPMHAFDATLLKGKMLAARHPKPGEKLEMLDDKTYSIADEDVVIADAENAVSLGGIIGGKPSAINDRTTELALEAAWFLPGGIRRASRRYGILTDSAYRFERGVDAGNLLRARDRAVALLQELAGAKIVAAPIVQGTAPIVTRDVKLRAGRAETIIGTKIKAEDIDHGLTALGLQKLESTPEATTWRTPSFRNDLEREIDLIEEIARLHGMENVPARINHGLQRESDADRTQDRLLALRQSLAARGWDECVTDSLVSPDQAGDAATTVALSNPLNELYTHMRSSLKHSLLAAAANNLARDNRQLKLFEIGRVYKKSKSLIAEPMHLGLLVAGEAHAASWWQTERPADLFDLMGAADFLTGAEKIPAAACVESGRMGAAALKKHGIKTSVFYAEFVLDEWLELKQEAALYQMLPQYPAVQRDVAVVVEQSMQHATVLKAIESAKIKELEKIELFDVFVDPDGKKIPPEKKSLAYALTYRAKERTLKEEEVNAWHEQLRERLKKELGCSFRET
jgi:phenylalanyl-tRNA synthetase beta chain